MESASAAQKAGLPEEPLGRALIHEASITNGSVRAAACFFAVGFTQCATFATFGQVPAVTKEVYSMTDSDITLLLSWGAIVYLPVIPLAGALLTARDGLRRGVVLGGALTALGQLVRSVPALAGTRGRGAAPWLHAGQMLNAATGCVIMAAPSRLSREWFPPQMWASVTGVMSMSMGVGWAVSTALAPHVVAGANGLHVLLYSELACGVAVLLAAVALFPREPPQPEGTPRPRCGGLPSMARQPSLMAVCLAGGLVSGALNAWRSSLATVLHGLSNMQVDSMVSASEACGLLAGMSGGILVDRVFPRKLKRAVLIALAAASACAAAFAATLVLAPRLVGVLAVACVMTGGIAGFATPLFYELISELAYPADESTPAAVMTVWNNACVIVGLSLAPRLHAATASVAFAGCVFVSAALMVPVADQYRRADAHAAAAQRVTQ